MASESVVPDQSTDEQIEKKVNEEMKVVEQGTISPSKEDIAIDEEQKLKSEELTSPEAPVAESEGKTVDKQISPSAIVEVEKAQKVDDALGLDVPAEDAPKVTEEPDPKLDVSSVLEPAVEVVEKEPEEQLNISDAPESKIQEPLEHSEVPPTQQPASEVGNKPEEALDAESKIVDKPELAVEEPEVTVSEPKIVEKPESAVEELQVEKGSEEISESESKVVENQESAVGVEEKPQGKSEFVEAFEKISEILEHKKVEDGELAKEREVGNDPQEISESESKVLENPESAVEVEEKPKEKSVVVEEDGKKSEMLEPKEGEKSELVKDEGVLVDKVEDVTDSLKEEQTSKDQETVACESSDTVLSTNQEDPSDPKDGVSVLPDLEKADVGDTKEEESRVDVVKGLSKEAPLEMEKVKEEKEEQNVKVEESTQPETAKIEDEIESVTAAEVTKKTFEGKEASREVEVVSEEKTEENVEDCVSTPVETTKDRDMEGVDVVNAAGAVKEPVEEPRKLALETTAIDTVEAVDELDKAAVVEEIEKSDAPNLEYPKDVNDSKTDGDLPKEEAPLEMEKVKEEKEEQNVKVEESTQPETAKIEDEIESITAAEVTKKNFEGKEASREVEVVSEEKTEENFEDCVTTPVETTKDRDMEGVDVVNAAGAVKEPVEEPSKLELETTAKDTVEAVDELDEAAEVVEETEKSDAPNLEYPKDVHDSKTDGDPPKEEVVTKSIHKQSNNIISKVKHSFVKVKKAIVGKSPGSKTVSSDV